MQNKSQIRRKIRALRKNLTVTEQKDSANAVAQSICKLIDNNQAAKISRIALFLSMDGEIGTQATIELLWKMNVEVYIPRIHPFNPQQLLFIQYNPDTPLIKSALGMFEPELNCAKVTPLAQLDIVFTPLVAFDHQGHRLGMGGGFYDRTLAHHYRQNQARPAIIGLAHDCQQVDMVPVEPWDLPLKQIITPSTHHCW
jgi:5-formyltetrahydrofolate cyclo-ligase